MQHLIQDLNSGLSVFKTTHGQVFGKALRVVSRGEATFAHEPNADFAIITKTQMAYFQTVTGDVWDRDISAELAHNGSCPGLLRAGWWQRTVEQINGLTFHHTLSDSPHATAKNYVRKSGGRPSIPYTIWVTQTGEILLCNALTEGPWHDHTGHRNTHLSVGLAGELHKYHPADVQLEAAARVAVWAIDTLPGIDRISQIWGHMDVGSYKGRTECPGWNSLASGVWKPDLFQLIERLTC